MKELLAWIEQLTKVLDKLEAKDNATLQDVKDHLQTYKVGYCVLV